MRPAHQAILLAILPPGSAANPHVLRVRCGWCALAEGKPAATITPDEQAGTLVARRLFSRAARCRGVSPGVSPLPACRR
ncbi:hypothetical protein BVG90_23700 [Serratia marcescens]|nr:hypothetical protein BVG90_23700 [Serratia marcescens]